MPIYAISVLYAQLTRDLFAIAKFLFISLWFLRTLTIFIARKRTDARYWYSKSVRLYVCPSVRYVPVSDENGLTYRHSFFMYGSPIILVLPACIKQLHEIPWALNTGGV